MTAHIEHNTEVVEPHTHQHTGSRILSFIMTRVRGLVFSALILSASTCSAAASIVYKASCTASVVDLKATGLVSITLINTSYATGYFYATNIKQMTAAHLHVGAVGQNGPPIAWAFNATYGSISGSIKASFIFNPSLNNISSLLAAGNVYFNIHTVAYPAGELRGQFMLVSAPSLNILAFGDSLTAGLVAYHDLQGKLVKLFFHPYTIKLQSLLKQRLPLLDELKRINIANGGISGDMVSNMALRLDRWLSESEKKGTAYDYVVVMGGINDINSGKAREPIMQGLEQMYERIKRHKARLVAMTTMSLASSDQPFYAINEEERRGLNNLIRQWIQSRRDRAEVEKEKDAPILIDMDVQIRYTNTSTYFCDGLHLSPEGYDRMGQEIFDGILPEFIEQA